MSGEVRISAWDWEGWRFTVATDPMPDRAVVGDLCCENPDIDLYYDDSDQRQLYCRNCRSPFPPEEPQPRALVALSEDRQWLVVLESPIAKWRGYWVVYARGFADRYGVENYIEDTGQDAHQVLAAWLEGRG